MSTVSPSALRLSLLSALLAWGAAAHAKPNGWQSDTCNASLACETANGTHVSYPIATNSEDSCEDQLAAADGARYVSSYGVCYLHVVEDCSCSYTWKDGNGLLHDSDTHMVSVASNSGKDPRFPNITGSLSVSTGAVLGFEGSLTQGVLHGDLFDETGLNVGELTLHPDNASAGTAAIDLVVFQEGVRYGAHGSVRLTGGGDAQVLSKEDEDEDEDETEDEDDIEITGFQLLFDAASPRPRASTGAVRPAR